MKAMGTSLPSKVSGTPPAKVQGVSSSAAANALSGLTMWLDASDTASITESAGAVSQWSDKSGAARHATQSSAGNKPITGTRTINALNAIDFDGTDDNMDFGSVISTTSYTKVIVAAPDVTNAGNALLSGIKASDTIYAASKANWSVYMSVSSLSSNLPIVANTPDIIIHTFDSTTNLSKLYVNGVFQGASWNPPGTATARKIGAYNSSQYFNGLMAEIAVYTRVLTLAEIKALSQGLATKWGVTLAGTAVEPDVSALRVVTLQNRIHTQQGSPGSTRTRQATRWGHIVAQDASDIVISVNNWYADGNADNLFDAPITIESMSFESEGGTVVPVYFKGSRSITLQCGVCDIQSDRILPASFSLSKFTKTEKFFVKTIVSVATGSTNIPRSESRRADNNSDDQAVTYDPAATTPSSIDVAGKFTATGTAFTTTTATLGFSPIVLGTAINDDPSFILVGDSITENTDDTEAGGFGGRGFASRAMHDAGATTLTNPIPSLNCGRASGKVNTFANGGRQKTYLRYVRFATDNYGTNNFGATGGDSVATVQGYLANLWAYMRTAGIEKIVRVKILPRTTSTDSFATEANQTPVTNGLSGGSIDLLNQWLDTKLADDTLDALISMDSVRGVDPLLWKVTGAANYATADGLHPTAAGHELMAAELRSAIAAL